MQNITISNEIISLINQVFEIEEKQKMIEQKNSINKNVKNLKGLLEEGFFQDFGITYHTPIGEDFNDTRTDCEVMHHEGESYENLVITQVIRPIIRIKQNNAVRIVQRASVIVQDKNTIKEEVTKSTQSKQNVVQQPLKPIPQNNIERQKQLKEFVNTQLQLICSNEDAKVFVSKLSKKSHS